MLKNSKVVLFVRPETFGPYYVETKCKIPFERRNCALNDNIKMDLRNKYSVQAY